MPVSKSEVLDLAATVLNKVAADLRDTNTPDTSTVIGAAFYQTVTVEGKTYTVTLMPAVVAS